MTFLKRKNQKTDNSEQEKNKKNDSGHEHLKQTNGEDMFEKGQFRKGNI